jgi:hypothetical protein
MERDTVQKETGNRLRKVQLRLLTTTNMPLWDLPLFFMSMAQLPGIITIHILPQTRSDPDLESRSTAQTGFYGYIKRMPRIQDTQRNRI